MRRDRPRQTAPGGNRCGPGRGDPDSRLVGRLLPGVSACRSGATARSTVRSTMRSTVCRLTAMPIPATRSWRTTSALPACRRHRSASPASSASSTFVRDRVADGRQPPGLSHRAMRANGPADRSLPSSPSCASSRVPPRSDARPGQDPSASAPSTPHPAPALRPSAEPRSAGASSSSPGSSRLPPDHGEGQFLMSSEGRFVVSPDTGWMRFLRELAVARAMGEARRAALAPLARTACRATILVNCRRILIVALHGRPSTGPEGTAASAVFRLPGVDDRTGALRPAPPGQERRSGLRRRIPGAPCPSVSRQMPDPA